MMDYESSVNQHYGQDDLSAKILKALIDTGKDVERLTRDDLTTFDHFHVGGLSETRKLGQMAELKPGTRVLDVGCGVGGPARTLASEFDCAVVGIDLTEAFIDAATMLTEHVGLAEKAQFKVGSALDLPVEDGSFDVVWTQFVTMNIDDKARMCHEFRRVLRPGGRLALHELQQSSGDPPYYPAFWAEEPALSFLHTAAQIRQVLTGSGFQEREWRDYTQDALDWWEQVRIAGQANPLGLNVIVAQNVPEKSANMRRSLAEGRLAAVRAIFERES